MFLINHNIPFFNVYQEIKNQNINLYTSHDSVLLLNFNIKLYLMNDIHSDLITSNADLSLNYIVFSHVNDFQNNMELLDKCIYTISQNSQLAFLYASKINKNPFPLGEKAIAKSDTYAYYYAQTVLFDRFKLGEPAIAKDAFFSYSYACNVIGRRFELGEEAISKSSEYSYLYAANVLKHRFPIGEKAIATNAEDSYYYARLVLKGRFELGEEAIKSDSSLYDKYLTFLNNPWN